MRHPPPSPEFDHVRVRLETALAPIRTRISRARERMAAQRQRPGPDPEVLAWAAQSQHAPADLAAVAQAVREGRTTWEKVAAGEADDLPEMKRFYSASLARSRQLIERWQEPAGEHERKEDADE